MWRPRTETVFVRKAAPKTETEGGIILPTEQQGLTLEGEVVYTAKGLEYLKGEKILYSKFSGSEVKIGSDSLFIIRSDDILAVWENENVQ